MKKKILLLCSLLAFILLLFIPIPALMLTTQSEVIRIEPFLKNQPFSIRWTHSVEKEDWEEFFIIKDDTILIESTRFKTFGAGVPNDAGENTFIKDGWVYMTDINQPIGETLRFQTGKTTNHRFQIKGSYLTLEPQVSYEVKVQKVPLYQLMVRLVKVK
ncbi:hypothetical protein GCM10008967_03770 [Bacillus carboniphilus]|uniref:DUF1850 domain-containing protein n=1 Tax=Bacillus carboniphilus TaxID=86663 RepID=A0ABN0VSU3_9BACI